MRKLWAILLLATAAVGQAAEQPTYDRTSIPPTAYISLAPYYKPVAACSGTDTSAALVSATTAAIAAGVPLHVPAGCYSFTTYATLPAGAVNIQADVPGTVTFQVATSNAVSSSGTLLRIAATTTRAWISGITFDGNTGSNTNLNPLIQVTSTQDAIFDHDTFINNNDTMLGFSSTNSSCIQYSIFRHTGQYKINSTTPVVGSGNNLSSFNGTGSGNCMVGNVFTDNRATPVNIAGQTGFTFSENRVIGDNTGWLNLTSGGGIAAFYSLGANNSQIRVTNNTVIGMTGNGIDLTCGKGYVVTGNTVINSGGAGLSITGDSSTPCNISDLAIDGNVIKNSFKAQATSITTSGATAAGSNGTLTTTSTTGVLAGQYLSGTNITAGAVVASVVANTSVTITGTITGGGVANGATVRFSTLYPVLTSEQGCIVLGTIPWGGASTVSNLTIGAANVCTDDQTIPSTQWGILLSPSVTVTNAQVDPGMIFSGNVQGQVSGALPAAGMSYATPTGSGPPVFGWTCPGAGAVTWDSSGEFIGVNACNSFAGNFLEYHRNGGSTLFKVSGDGTLTAASGATVNGDTVGINVSSNHNTNIGTGTSTGTTSIGNSAGTGSAVTVAAPTTFAFGTSLSQASWGLAGLGIVGSAATFNDTTTGSGGVASDAAYAFGAATVTNTQGTANVLTNLVNVYFGVPVCGSGWSSCTNVYSTYAGGKTFALGSIGGSGGAAINGAAINLNASSNFATNINTGNSPNTTTIGNSLSTLAIAAGTVTQTATSFSGLITPTSTAGIAGTVGADSPAAGSVGQLYSVYCPGTSTATITVTIASPAVVTWSSHPFSASGPANWTCPINFTTSSALPTGIVAATNYFIIGSSLSGDTFQIADTAAHAISATNAVNTSGSQSGTQTGWVGALLGTGGNGVLAADMAVVAGDWDCSAVAIFGEVTTLTGTGYFAGINAGAIILGNASTFTETRTPSGAWGANNSGIPTPVVQENISATTNIGLSVRSDFTVGSQNGGGFLRCRRMR